MKIRSDGMEVSGYASTLFRGFPTFTDLHSPSSGVPSRVGCSYAEALLPWLYVWGVPPPLRHSIHQIGEGVWYTLHDNEAAMLIGKPSCQKNSYSYSNFPFFSRLLGFPNYGGKGKEIN